MPAQLVGAHMRIRDGVGNALRAGREIGCTAVQVFTSNPQQWSARPVTDEMARDFKSAVAETGISAVICHDSYLVNLSAFDEEIAAKSFEALKQEMNRCAAYGIRFLVSHMGGHKNQTTAEAILKVAEAGAAVLDETPESVTLCMETTAGQGTSLNSRFEEIAMILELCKGHPRLGVCLDTCHVFAAGYDIRTPETFEKTFAEFDRVVGLNRLKAIHINDSMKGLGSRIDRHEDIGKGMIGDEAFRLLMNDRRFEDVPMTLETEAANHATNLAHLRSLFKS